LTGGGARIPRIVDLAKKELKLPCRIGKPDCFYGLEDDLSFATACGLILKSTNIEGKKIRKENQPSGGFWEKVKEKLKVFIP
jgi:cell division ATPase FtsA